MRRKASDLTVFDQSFSAALEELTNLRRRSLEVGLSLNDIDGVETALRRYAEAFRSVAAHEVANGLDENSGAQGALRQAVHKAEAIFFATKRDRLLKDMLMLRRNEKDFMLRHAEKYLETFETNLAVMMADLEADTAFDEAGRATAAAALATYALEFRRYVNAIRQTGLTADDGLLGRMTAEIQRSDAIVARFRDESKTAVADTMRRQVVTMGILSLAIAVTVAGAVIAIAGSILRPVRAMTEVMGALSAGNRQVVVPFATERSEIGEMARSVATFKDGLIKAESLRQEVDRRMAEDLAEAKRRADLTARFDQSVGALLARLGDAVNTTRASSDEMKMSADESEQRSAAVSAAARQVVANVETVASAGAELDASIGEVASHAGTLAAVASQVGERVRAAAGRYEDLYDAAGRIGAAVNLINGIAAQTNHLALNATIESARAGEAGKGFSVVANEVKLLAAQTGRVTKEIGAMIANIQREVGDGVEGVKLLTADTGKLLDLAVGIAGAIEEQAAATREIFRNVQEVSAANEEVAGNIVEVAKGTAVTRDVAVRLHSVAKALREETGVLGTAIEGFLRQVRSA